MKNKKSSYLISLLAVISGFGVLLAVILYETNKVSLEALINIGALWLAILFFLDFIVGVFSKQIGFRGVVLSVNESPVLYFIRLVFSFVLAIISILVFFEVIQV